MTVILYSTHCPRCNIAEKKLKEKHIEYTECNDVDLMMSKGFDTVPMLEVDGTTMGFAEMINWINGKE